MAKIPQGILGGLRGRVGNVVGAAWKGVNYIRSMPLSVANPNTTLQQAQRGAFTSCVALARYLLSDLIATYWDPFARRMSGYNHFISINIDAFATAGLETPANFSSARGILTGVSTLVTAGLIGVGYTMTWVDNSGSGDALASDQAVALVFNETRNLWLFHTDVAVIRSTETISLAYTGTQDADVLHGYLFFIRVNLEKISDSSYDEGVTA